VSPAVRARQTWDLVSADLTVPPPTRLEDRAYAASASALLAIVRELPDDATTVVLVGHNPGIEDLASALTGRYVSMPTSALAVIGWAGEWASAGTVSADLLASGRPPEGAPS
jgi:phosphohistidine phosphatase